MHTFVVRVFVAENLDGFNGVIEEPRTGERRPFHDAAMLIALLRAATVGHGEGEDAIHGAVASAAAPPEHERTGR